MGFVIVKSEMIRQWVSWTFYGLVYTAFEGILFMVCGVVFNMFCWYVLRNYIEMLSIMTSIFNSNTG